MKSVVCVFCFLISIFFSFFMTGCKDFYSADDGEIQNETATNENKSSNIETGSNPTTEGSLISVKNPKATRTEETKADTETMPVEQKAIEDTKIAETASEREFDQSKNNPVTENTRTEIATAVDNENIRREKSIAEENFPPIAVPVITAEEAEKLNAELLVEFEKNEKNREKERERLERGYRLVLSEQFADCKNILLSKTNEEQLSKKGYDLVDFKNREIPKVWSLDYSTIPTDAIFQKTNDGFNIISDHDAIRFIGQHLNGMRSSFLFELKVENNSDKESEIAFGVHNSGIIKNGYKPLVTETIHSRDKKTIEVELSVFEQLSSIAPTISVKGDITLSNLTIYRKDHDDFSIIEGEIVERSILPDPKDTDYPDYRYTAHFEGNAILSGIPCNKELVLSIDGFLNKKVLPTNSLKVGDKIKCAFVPIDSIPEELASIQEADDLSLFTLDSYLVTSYSKITSYTDPKTNYNALIPFKSDVFEFKSVFNRGFNPPVPDNIREAQKKQIEKDLADANRMISYLEKNGDEIEQKFQSDWAEEKERYPDGFNTLKNEDGEISLYWRNIDNSFWCLPPNHTLIPKNPNKLSKYQIDAIVAFRDFLESNGIQLIFSLVPTPYEVSARIFNRGYRDVPDIQSAVYVKQLSEAGVECPYMIDSIIENYNRFPFSYRFP